MDNIGEPEKVTKARMDCCLRACLDQWASLQGHRSSDLLKISFVLKNYDTNTHPWIYGSLRLKHDPTIKVNVCILGEDQLCKEAKDHGLPFISPRGLACMKRKAKLITKIVGKYDQFLASPTIMKKIPRSLDAALNRAGKRPFVVMPGESLQDKIREMRVVVQFRTKDSPYLLFPIGNMGMKLQKLSDNLEVAIDHVLSLLPLKWDNVMCIHIASKKGTWLPVYD
ncbi:hypothetical protein HPB48_013176 [Haemaphysalis longicornis]|uniref:Ribosomal protein n=1 Tax=Haemaphysalis longicornis TaxID=44386 RepID=A0A9J6H4E1_HAELO|nr:hypothetical protein HPB48_013176 [Haemaphysalis longicornis]